MKRLVIGTRKSELALWQAKWVRERLIEAHPGLEVELAETDTAGDRDLATPLPLVDGKGVFTAEIEEGLRDGTIDLAVHSLKDLPTELPEGFEAAAFDYVKLGGWVEALGPLTAPTTNQRLYRVGPDGTMEDITKLFRRKP